MNHFQGRVTCPYGQSKDDGGRQLLTGNALGRAVLPHPRDQRPKQRIKVEVKKQLTRRRPNDAVYCSCRCNGPDANARYCKCPTGFQCTSLLDPIDRLGSKELAGSYCIKEGTEYTKQTNVGSECQATPNQQDQPGNCGSYDGSGQ